MHGPKGWQFSYIFSCAINRINSLYEIIKAPKQSSVVALRYKVLDQQGTIVSWSVSWFNNRQLLDSNANDLWPNLWLHSPSRIPSPLDFIFIIRGLLCFRHFIVFQQFVCCCHRMFFFSSSCVQMFYESLEVFSSHPHSLHLFCSLLSVCCDCDCDCKEKINLLPSTKTF